MGTQERRGFDATRAQHDGVDQGPVKLGEAVAMVAARMRPEAS